MSKEKKDTIYNAFSDLSRLLEKKNIPLKQVSEPETRQETPHDTSVDMNDDPLDFYEAMKDVKVLKQKETYMERKTPPIAPFTSHKETGKRLLEESLDEANTINVTNLPEYMEGFVEGTNPITLDKLRTGAFSVQKTLDLHGYPVEEASLLFEEFIQNAIRTGLNCVMVIHGRGLKSKGVAVLKEELKAWIVKAMHRKWIVAFSNAIMRDGGPGATYILLRKKPTKKRMKIMG